MLTLQKFWENPSWTLDYPQIQCEEITKEVYRVWVKNIHLIYVFALRLLLTTFGWALISSKVANEYFLW